MSIVSSPPIIGLQATAAQCDAEPARLKRGSRRTECEGEPEGR